MQGWSEEGGTGLNFIDVCLLEICIHFAPPPFSRGSQSGSGVIESREKIV